MIFFTWVELSDWSRGRTQLNGIRGTGIARVSSPGFGKRFQDDRSRLQHVAPQGVETSGTVFAVTEQTQHTHLSRHSSATGTITPYRRLGTLVYMLVGLPADNPLTATSPISLE
ncbi:hypothetical protein AVEN_107924-1 [Araneus ventricosus]|uniref:Uncharacterized protein n=1 Tax=Araneus ventricosus TaxID=182803 RepID=A0A4Y2KZF0_ARAVE|nr:hypothetical protein AVEN_107924-1 [Araneus ventricosus]